MTRKERRNLRKDRDLISELYSIISKYLPKLLDMFAELSDSRNQSYTIYEMKTICVIRLFGSLCGLTTMTDISTDDFNTDAVLKIYLKYVAKILKSFLSGKRFKMFSRILR